MSELVQITDYEERGIERLLSQFRNKTRIEAVIKAAAEAIQTVEDLNYDLINTTRFETAEGVHLDHWGAIVGEERGGLSDDDYRLFISARILVNISEGTADELIQVFDLIDGDATVHFAQLLYAAYEIYTYRDPGDNLSQPLKNRISAMMESMRPAGVAGQLIEVPDSYFGWDGDPSALGFDVGVFAEVF